MSWFLVLKTLHILSAIVAVGANVTYAVWSLRGRAEPEHLGFALRGVKFIDDRVANPAYGVLLVTGLIMAFTQYTIGTRWILTGLGLYIILAVTAVVRYSPTLGRQVALVEAGRADSDEYRAADARARGVGMFLGVLLVVAVVVMVFKPTF